MSKATLKGGLLTVMMVGFTRRSLHEGVPAANKDCERPCLSDMASLCLLAPFIGVRTIKAERETSRDFKKRQEKKKMMKFKGV